MGLSALLLVKDPEVASGPEPSLSATTTASTGPLPSPSAGPLPTASVEEAPSPAPSAPEPASSPKSPVPFDDLELTSDERWSPQEKAEFLAQAEAVASAQPSARALTEVARACLGTGDLERARSAMKQALALDPEFPAAYRIRGMILMRSQRAKSTKPGPFGDLLQTSAERDFERALQLDPQDWQALRERAVVRTNLGDLAGAEADFAGWIEAEPSAAAYNARAYFEFGRGRQEAAKADLGELAASRAPLERLLALQPTDRQGLLLMLRVLIGAEDWAAVLKVCDRLLALQPPLGEPNLSEVKQNRAYALQALPSATPAPR